MKRLLFIYYMFPPMVGGWRAIGSSVRYFAELGWQTTVLSAAETVSYPKDYSTLKQIPAEVEVHRVGHRERPRKLQALLNRLRINIDFPDSYKDWYTPALQEGRKIIRSQKIDAIFSYGPPYTSHFVAMQLKKEFNLPWVVCFADLWSGNSFLLNERTLIQPLCALQTRRIYYGEQALVKNADRIVVRGWYQQQHLCEAQTLQESKVTVINHGYDESDFLTMTPRALYPDRLTITFIGTFYPQFQMSFQTFLRVVREVAPDSEMVFVGRGGETLSAPNLTRIMYLPSHKALSFCLGSDFLFVVMPPDARWIPMKTYDYLRLGKPILALVPDDGDVARIIREAKAGFVLPYEAEKMQAQLRTIFDQWRQGKFKDFKPDQAYVAQLERGVLTRQLVNIFDELTS